MGIIKNLFGKSNDKADYPSINWIPLTEHKQLTEIIQNSNLKYQAIFKHSTRCGISRSVLKQFERQENNESIDFYYLDLLSYRAISDEIVEKFGVMHQSPQLLVIKEGAVVAHGSHYDIMTIKI
ncbi:bacillithiol system redox-active protein YtxJ [Aureibaculum marinum]|uniref:Bacillithiol system redox-active protein YtxJ n=1 Tax=Aureibaculum marinum TaxID=2487930 RepID=A0A3N4NDU4_9FLAO|nr:bacillithiol system redox-active protein YtxJ [Aureibaculum marinum]RPD94474.1 bacillithiol system redox-active protein YtxJ [Aureibaculum marinum]